MSARLPAIHGRPCYSSADLSDGMVLRIETARARAGANRVPIPRTLGSIPSGFLATGEQESKRRGAKDIDGADVRGGAQAAFSGHTPEAGAIASAVAFVNHRVSVRSA